MFVIELGGEKRKYLVQIAVILSDERTPTSYMENGIYNVLLHLW